MVAVNFVAMSHMNVHNIKAVLAVIRSITYLLLHYECLSLFFFSYIPCILYDT